jgi:hypothetical protein
MSERDIESLFIETGFYDALGYDGIGADIRSEYSLQDNRRPDYITLDNNENVIAVYEFKTSGRSLPDNEGQLFEYMDELQSDYGVLTNGEEFRVYERTEERPIETISIMSITETQAKKLASTLKKRELDLSKSEDVKQFREELDPIPLDERANLGQEHFFDTFRLEEGSPFADLVMGMMDLLHELRDEQEANFVIGAYDFWEATYASDPDEIPSEWEPFIQGDQSLRDFMFCLESGHALLSRLLLAKATEDHGFFDGTGYNGVDDYFRELRGFGDEINLDAFPVAATNLIEDMRERLVEGLFQDDIFTWWTDGYSEEVGRHHESGANQFRDVAVRRGDEGGITRVSDKTRIRFSRAVAEVFANILRFDFTDVQGDLLGNLYQRYFSPETRKALGEFYTPQPVVDYIMDGVEYNRGVSNERLIDPACGSGTFLVDAVERYIEDVNRYAVGEPDWEQQLTELCTKPHIVGLDIHPFAVLMAQIRFVVAILPAYEKAKRRNPDFTLSRLPIYRTDTLRNERELTGVDIGDDGSTQMTLGAVTEDDQDVRIPVPLPVEVDGDESVKTDDDGFLIRRVRMPLFDTIQLNTGVGNFGEYFAALQGVLDTVKAHMRLAEEFGKDFDWTYQSGLEKRVNRYTSQQYTGIEDFFEPYVNDMLENVRYLQEEHNDGRLFKMFEDKVLSLVIKNYMEYDYVVGNPPYVRVQNLPDNQKAMMEQLYEATTGNYDIYCPFYERSLDWLTDRGRLGFITPNQFMVTDYGQGLRRVLLRESQIQEVYDFRDSGVFEDATNYPAVVIVENNSNTNAQRNNDIRCVRVKRSAGEGQDRKLNDAIIKTVCDHCDDPGYSDDYIDVFDFPQTRLDEQYWSLMPPEEIEVIDSLEKESSDTVGSITDSVFAGTQTSANDVFLVTPIDADRVQPEDSDRTVTIVPKGEEKEYEIETDTLRPWLQGRDVGRWRGSWSGQHVIVPYSIERDKNGELTADLLSQKYLKSNLPLTWDYLCEHRNELNKREDGRFKGRDDWYDFGYPKSMDRFEDPKLIGAEIASEPTFMFDSGSWYFKSAYGIQLETQHHDRTEMFAGLLNSNVLDFYLKHYTSLKMGGYYKYTTNYLSPLPVPWEKKEQTSKIRGAISRITEMLDLSSKIDRFPEAYIGEYNGQIDYITYEWQTRRYPINADVQGDVNGEFSVQAGRTDTIRDPAMYSDNRDARKKRAEYVCTAVNGRNAKRSEEMTIPIPQSDDGVEELLSQLEADQRKVEQTDIDELEAEVNEAVYELFDLTGDERVVIEEYLEVF